MRVQSLAAPSAARHCSADVGDLAEQAQRILRDRHETPSTVEPGRVLVDRVDHHEPRTSDVACRHCPPQGNGFAEIASDFGVPTAEVEDVIRVASASPPEFFIDHSLGR